MEVIVNTDISEGCGCSNILLELRKVYRYSCEEHGRILSMFYYTWYSQPPFCHVKSKRGVAPAKGNESLGSLAF